MRVLLTTDTVGGVWTFTRELAAGLLQRGHFVALVSLGRLPSASQPAWLSRVESEYADDFRFFASDAPLEWMTSNESAYSAVEPLLLRIIDEFVIDAIHASQFCFGALPVSLPKIITAHSDVFTWADACRRDGLGESVWLQTYRALVEAGLAGATAMVSPTHWMRDALIRHFPACPEAHVILNGRTLPQSPSTISRKLQAVTIGRLWDEAKGLTVLNHLDDAVPVQVAGDTNFEGGQMPQLQNVRFLGHLDEDEVLTLFRSSSVYLATSIYEPFGLAPLEAALCGCGVVARDIPSLREVWGDAAEYFTNGEDLGKLLSILSRSPDQLDFLRTRSTEHASRLSSARMVDTYVDLYQHLLTRANTREEVLAHAG